MGEQRVNGTAPCRMAGCLATLVVIVVSTMVSAQDKPDRGRYCRVDLIQVIEDAQGNCLANEFEIEDCDTGMFGTLQEPCNVTTFDPLGCASPNTGHCSTYFTNKGRNQHCRVTIRDTAGRPVVCHIDPAVYEDRQAKRHKSVGDLKFGRSQQGARVFRVFFRDKNRVVRYVEARTATIHVTPGEVPSVIATALEVPPPKSYEAGDWIEATIKSEAVGVDGVVISFPCRGETFTCFVHRLTHPTKSSP